MGFASRRPGAGSGDDHAVLGLDHRGLEALGTAGMLSVGPLGAWVGIGLAIAFVLRRRDNSREPNHGAGDSELDWGWASTTALDVTLAVAILTSQGLLYP